MFTKSEALRLYVKKLQVACSECVVIVEGKHDVAALSPLLETADFFTLNEKSKKSLYEIAEHIASKWKSAILLFDNDAKGMELKKMSSYLRSHGIKVHTEEKLLKLARVCNVEDLCSASLIRDF